MLLVFGLLIVFLPALIVVDGLAYVATAFDAKVMCSGVNVSGRAPADIEQQDLRATRLFPVQVEVDSERKEVRASIFGMYVNKAIYRDRLGCTLMLPGSENAMDMEAIPQWPTANSKEAIWPEGNIVAPTETYPKIDSQAMAHALGFAFGENDAENILNTRAVVIVHSGRIVAERYARGYTANMPMGGWSMTKSVTNALVGVLVARGQLKLHDAARIEEWSTADDPRSAITLDQLLRMSSGLEWTEETITTDLLRMMYREPDTGGYAASMPLVHRPDSQWVYSSGSSNVISRIIRSSFGDRYQEYLRFPYTDLFQELGMESAVFEPDAYGTYVGSSYLYATARDWARFGLLFLRNGIWQGKRILPEGWVEYSTTPTAQSPNGSYGASFWLNAGSPDTPEDRWMPKLATDIYTARGLDGQFITVLPSSDLVVVRLGYTPNYMERWDHQRFLQLIQNSIRSAIPPPRT